MVIAAHIDSLYLPDSQLYESLSYLAGMHPEAQFIVFTRHDTKKKDGPSNMQFIDVRPGTRNSVVLHFWYNYRLPSLLKKYRASIFFSGIGLCSFSTNVPQWPVVENTSFLNQQGIIKFDTNRYQRRFFNKILNAAAGIVVRQAYMATQIKQKYKGDAKFYTLGEHFFDRYKPIPWEAGQAVLDNVSDGIEYFLCIGTPVTRRYVTMVLKAFSLFKTRLKSSLKLVLTLESVRLEECVKDLRLYKFRKDVIVIDEYTRYSYQQLIAAAYAVLYLPSEITGYSERGLPAMQLGTPVITIDTPEHRCMYKDAALFSEPAEKSIAENMMQLYKDEQLRDQQIAKGLQLTADATLPAMGERLWKIIEGETAERSSG